MNISVPDELKQRMQPLENTMNWSRIAADAFRQAVENAEYLASIRSSVKRRLMQTEVEDMGSIEKTAHRDGQQWAANDARMIELRRLEQHVDKGGLEFPNWEALVRVILGEDFEENRGDWLGHRSRSEAVWSTATRNLMPTLSPTARLRCWRRLTRME